MSADIEACIRNNVAWPKLSKTMKQLLGNSSREYEKMVIDFSVKNQLRHKNNLIRSVRRNEEQYYEAMMQYSRSHLMLFPYHLCDIIVRELRTTPFQYYIDMMQDLMTQERSYDSLPNFTAADCLRLLGIGRNQYIDLMNQCRSTKKLFRRRPIRELLPAHPIEVAIEPWWMVQVGSVMEDDVKSSAQSEKDVIDILIDDGAQLTGTLDANVIQKLYYRGLVYFDVPVHDTDCIIVPPLDGFVMNRVLGDYFETLLYKIFVTIDEHTPVGEVGLGLLLANILQIDAQLVRNAISLFCRLGFARKRLTGLENMALHVTWAKHMRFDDEVQDLPKWSIDLDTDLAMTPAGDDSSRIIGDDDDACSTTAPETPLPPPVIAEELTGRRMGFLFDSTLTAFLMMGNLSNSLKTHAVTLFEVGKLSDEALDNFVDELKKVRSFGEGEAQQYFEHAQTLRLTIETLRESHELDLLRCESLSALDSHARSRLLRKNYQLLISMAPLSPEISPISCAKPAHFGPPIAEVNSPWWRLYIYDQLGTGPTSLLLAKGTRQSKIPDELRCKSRQLLMGTWTHEPATVQADTCLATLNDTLVNSSVLLQSYADDIGLQIVHVPFPLLDLPESDVPEPTTESGPLHRHPHIIRLCNKLGLRSACGYATLVRTSCDSDASPSSCASGDGSSPMGLDLSAVQAAAMNPNSIVNKDPRRCPSNESAASRDDQIYTQWTLFDFVFGLPLFDSRLSQRVCDNVNRQRLFDASRRADVEEMNCNISISLLDFIKRFQPVFDDEAEESDASAVHRVPYPLTNLMFQDGHVSLFDDGR